MHFLLPFLFLISSCQAAPQTTVTSISTVSKLPTSSTRPLAGLLATASASENTDVPPIVFQFTATQQSKRKFKKFWPEGKSRFRTPANFQDPNPSKIERISKSPLSGFSKQSRSSAKKRIAKSELSNLNNTAGKVTTAKPSLVLQDYFGTPVPEDLLTKKNSDLFIPKQTFPIPFLLSNDLSSDQFDQSALFERLQSITGAQPVGVTRDIAQNTQHNTGHAKQIKHLQESLPTESKRLSYKKRVPSKNHPEVETRKEEQSIVNRKENARQLIDPLGRQSSRREHPQKIPKSQKEQKDTDPLPLRHKKTQKVKKRNLEKSFVGTLDRYQYKNEDGSITWGYQNEDGGFKEETIGMDCITHGRYGYTDPSGHQREYGYTSGVRCDPDTRKVGMSGLGSDGSRGTNGFFDYTQNRFVMPDGRRVTVIVNEHNKARGRRY